MDKIGKILTERYGWEVYPLPSPLVEQREPKKEWELEQAENEELIETDSAN
jgi:hypothetical protein